MTIPEAVQLVIQAGTLSHGGDVFVLDMGKPVSILELAKTMINLMGKTARSETKPNGDIEIIFTGLRPGEKLYEELLIGENCVGTDHPMITRAIESKLSNDALNSLLENLAVAVNADRQNDHLIGLLKSAVPEYKPDAALYTSNHDSSNNVLKLNSTTKLAE